jgi:hypothetical protein
MTAAKDRAISSSTGAFSADGLRILVPGMEATARRVLAGVGYFALEDDRSCEGADPVSGPPTAGPRHRMSGREQFWVGAVSTILPTYDRDPLADV